MRVGHVHHLALGGVHFIGYVGDSGYHVHVELPVKPLLHDLQMEQAEETAAEAEAQGQGGLGLEDEGRIVELELLQRRAQILVFVGLHRIDSREEHWLDLLEAGNGLGAGPVHMGDGIADLHLYGRLDTGDDIAHIAGSHLVCGTHPQPEIADLIGLVFLARIEELYLVALAYHSVDHLEIGDHSAEGIEYRVENQGLERCLWVALRSGETLHHGVQYGRHALTGLRTAQQDVLPVAAYQVHDLVADHVHHGRVHIYLVEHGDNLQVMVDGQVEIGYGLGLDTLGSVHHQQGTLTGGDGAGYLVGKIHVARSVDEVKDIFLTLVVVHHLDRMALDSDAFLPLEIHRVQDLVLHLSLGQGMSVFEQTVRQSALAVVYVRYNAEIPDIFHFLQIIAANILS